MSAKRDGVSNSKDTLLLDMMAINQAPSIFVLTDIRM